MSVRVEAANAEYLANTNLGAASAISGGGWFRIAALPGAGTVDYFFSIDDGASRGPALGVDENGKLVLRDMNAGANATGTATLSTATWYYVWFTLPWVGGGNVVCQAFLDGSETLDVQDTSLFFGTGTMRVRLGAMQINTTTTFDGDLVGWKLWSTSRAASAAASEMACGNAVSATNLLAEWKLTADPWTADTGGGGFTLTAAGTLSDPSSTPAGYSVTCAGGIPAGVLAALLEENDL